MNKNTLIIAAVIAAVVLVGGYAYMQKSKTHTTTVNLGGKSISATFSE